MKKSRVSVQPLQQGQVWQVKDANLQINQVGKLLVHYKLFRGNAKRTPTSLSGKEVIQNYLRQNKAVLVQG